MTNKLVKLTLIEGDPVLVNFDNVSHVITEQNASVIYTTRNEGYIVIIVIENLEYIMKMAK